MKFSSYHYANIDNHDDTLIERLKEFDDPDVEHRHFGVQIQNRPYIIYSINKKKPYSIQDFGTSEQLFQEEIRIDSGHIPVIQKDYRMNILTNLLNNNLPISYNHNYEEQRNQIVNWLVLIHSRYLFEPQTLHQSIRIFDRFVSLKLVDVIDYQKYALTAFWMAAKIEQRKVKELKIWLTFGKGYFLDQILLSEKQIMEALQYQLVSNTSQRFLYNFATFFLLEPKAFTLCNYLLELTLLDITYLKYQSSVIGLSCLLVCSKVLRKQMPQKIVSEIQNLCCLLNMKTKLLYECAKKVCKTLQIASVNPLNSVYRKYSSKRYFKIALIKLGRI